MKKLDQKAIEADRAEAERLGRFISQIEIFPGTLEEYKILKSDEFIIVDTGLRDKGICLTTLLNTTLLPDYIPSQEELDHRREARNLAEFVVKNKVVAIVNARSVHVQVPPDKYDPIGYLKPNYGLPIARTKSD